MLKELLLGLSIGLLLHGCADNEINDTHSTRCQVYRQGESVGPFVQCVERLLEDIPKAQYDSELCQNLNTLPTQFYYYRCIAVTTGNVHACERYYAAHAQKRLSQLPPVMQCDAPSHHLIEYVF